MPRFVIEPARREDSPALCRLVRSVPMAGMISVSMEREPDYFLAAEVQGDEGDVFVARDRETGGIGGVAAVRTRTIFVNGEPARVPYLSDLRIAPGHRGGTLLARAYAYLRERLISGDAYAQTIVVNDNAEALRLLTSGRAGLPAYLPFGDYACPAILMGKPSGRAAPGLEIVRAGPSHLRAMQAFYDLQAPRKQFQPAYDFSALDGAYMRGQRLEDFFLAYRNGGMVGMAGVWDQRAYKQTRVQGYGGALRWLRPALNALAPLAGTFPLPPAGSLIDSFHLHSMVVKDDDPLILAALIAEIRNSFCDHGYAYFLCGLDAKDPLRGALEGLRTQAFGGRHFLATFGKDPRPGLKPGPFYLESARI